MKAEDRLAEIEENNELAKNASKNGDWDAYGRYCSEQDMAWLIDRVKKLSWLLNDIHTNGPGLTDAELRIVTGDIPE